MLGGSRRTSCRVSLLSRSIRDMEYGSPNPHHAVCSAWHAKLAEVAAWECRLAEHDSKRAAEDAAATVSTVLSTELSTASITRVGREVQ